MEEVKNYTEHIVKPFSIENGECYSVLDNGAVAGIFISNGVVEHWPNGDAKGYIHYKSHAGLFSTRNILNPVILAGPDIDGHDTFLYGRGLGIRYSTEEEKSLLFLWLKKKQFGFNQETKEIYKTNKSNTLDIQKKENKVVKQETKVYQIWMEGFAITGNSSKATLLGEMEAESFQQACDKYIEENPEYKKLYSGKSIWGCRLFDNEADARKSFG